VNIAIAPASLDDLANAANNEHALLAGDAQRMIKRAIQIGEILKRAKARLAHGEWFPWIKKNLTFAPRMAQNYMRVAANTKRVAHLDATSVREAVALLAEPKDEAPTAQHPAPTTSGEPTMWEPGPEDVYNNDPDLEKELTDIKDESRRRQGEIENLSANLSEKESEISRLQKQNAGTATELEDLRKLKADKATVEKALKDLHELEKRKQDLFKDSESLRVATDVLVRSREFFTRECMQVAALQFRPGTVEAIRQDMAGLLELVENWLQAMRQKFMEDA